MLGFVAVATLCELEELDVSSCYQLGDVFLEKVTAAKSTNTILLIDIGGFSELLVLILRNGIFVFAGTSITDECIARVQKSGATVKLNLQSLAHIHLIPDVYDRLGIFHIASLCIE